MHPFWWLAPPPSPRRGDFILRYALSEGIASRSFIVPPHSGGEGGAVRHQRGESHRRWLIIVMFIMPYDTDSQSRNADFISIAAKSGYPQPSARRAVKLKNPPAAGRSILRTRTPKVCLKAERLQSKMPAIFSWQAFGFAALFQTDRIGIRLIISGTSLLTF